MSVLILAEGDYHCGNLLGLVPPSEQTGKLKHVQKILWDWRKAEIAAIGPVDIHMINGDLTDGPGKKDSIGLLTTDTEEQAEWAEEAVRQVQAKTRFFTYGSPYHVNTSYNTERSIAKAFDCDIADTARFQVNGKRFKFRHVVGRSDTPYGQGTQVQKEIVRDVLQAALDDHDQADIQGRSHCHYWTRVDVKDKTAFTMPCWELPLDTKGSVYPRTLRTMYYDVGFVLIEVMDDGEVIIRPRRMDIRGLTKVRYEVIK
jgi:hypothetical protein